MLELRSRISGAPPPKLQDGRVCTLNMEYGIRYAPTVLVRACYLQF
jgi:hypothetical protein